MSLGTLYNLTSLVIVPHDRDQVLAGRVPHVARQPRQGQRRPVDAAHEQPPEDDLVELGICTPCQVSVQLSTKI